MSEAPKPSATIRSMICRFSSSTAMLGQALRQDTVYDDADKREADHEQAGDSARFEGHFRQALIEAGYDASVVRTFACTETFMPMKPAAPEARPMMKPTGACQLRACGGRHDDDHADNGNGSTI
ncbi:MAG: hypothetical protein R3B98_06825 [Hyphomonas sp.]